jgi:hypothetical protein
MKLTTIIASFIGFTFLICHTPKATAITEIPLTFLQSELANEQKDIEKTLTMDFGAAQGIQKNFSNKRRLNLSRDLKLILDSLGSYATLGISNREIIYLQLFRVWNERLDLIKLGVINEIVVVDAVDYRLEYQEGILRDFSSWLLSTSAMPSKLKDQLTSELERHSDFHKLIVSSSNDKTKFVHNTKIEFARSETVRLQQFQQTIEDYLVSWIADVTPGEVIIFRLRLSESTNNDIADKINKKLMDLKWPLLREKLLAPEFTTCSQII